MIVTGAGLSLVAQPVSPPSPRQATIVGVTGGRAHHAFLLFRQCNLGGHEVIHEFLYFPDCLVALLGLTEKVASPNNFQHHSPEVLTLGRPETRINPYNS